MLRHRFVYSMVFLICLVHIASARGRKAQPILPDIEVIFRSGDVITDGRTILSLHPEIALSRTLEILTLAQFTDGTFAVLSNQRGIVMERGAILDGETVRGILTTPEFSRGGHFVFNCLVDGQAVCSDTDVIADQGDTIDGRLIFQAFAPVANRQGEIAFVARYLNMDNTGGEGIFTVRRGLVVGTGDTIDGVPFFAPTSGVFITPHGELAFLGAPTPQLEQSGVYTETRFVLGVGSDVEGHTIELVSNPALTDRGEILALLHLTDGDQWIYSTTRGILLRDTQIIDGSPVAILQRFELGTQHEEIVAALVLTDGRGLIYSTTRGILLSDTLPIDDQPILQFGGFSVVRQAIAAQLFFDNGQDAVILKRFTSNSNRMAHR